MKAVISTEKLKEAITYIKSPKGTKIALAIGLSAILIIFVMNMFSTEKKSPAAASEEKSSEAYTLELEKRVLQIIESIEGVGNSKILITLENGVENIYADEQKSNTDSTEDVDEQSGSKKTTEREDTENTIVIIDNDNGGREPVIKTKIEPRVKGVVIVCEGGDNELVKQRVTDAVTTALSIPLKKVCITKLS